MLARLQWLIERFRFNPETTRLRWWLAGSEVVIVLLMAGGLSLYAGGRLRQVADSQGTARVQLGGAMARETLRRMHEDALVSARTLAESSVLRAALAGRGESPTTALRHLCQTPVDACAVFNGASLAAQAGRQLPWNEIFLKTGGQGPMFFAAPLRLAEPVFGASLPMPDSPGVRVYVSRPLDGTLARDLGRAAGLELRIINYRDFTAAPVDTLTSLHVAGLADGQSAVARIS